MAERMQLGEAALEAARCTIQRRKKDSRHIKCRNSQAASELAWHREEIQALAGGDQCPKGLPELLAGEAGRIIDLFSEAFKFQTLILRRGKANWRKRRPLKFRQLFEMLQASKRAMVENYLLKRELMGKDLADDDLNEANQPDSEETDCP